jgi:hypothetical protein
VDFGVGDAGVVVDDGVHVCGADGGFVVAAAPAGASGGGLAVAVPGLAAEVAPAAAVGHVAEFLDVDVQQVAGVFVFVAADRLAGDPVEVGEPVGPVTGQHGVHGGGGQAELVGDRDRAEASFAA